MGDLGKDEWQWRTVVHQRPSTNTLYVAPRTRSFGPPSAYLDRVWAIMLMGLVVYPAHQTPPVLVVPLSPSRRACCSTVGPFLEGSSAFLGISYRLVSRIHNGLNR